MPISAKQSIPSDAISGAEPGNILIVDDNPNNLQVLSGILHAADYKVRPALSGELALRAIAAQAPDLILLDVRMPGMDGYETCRRIKANPSHKDIQIIFISALNEIDDKLDAFRVGAVDYITKPFQADEVLARVKTQVQLAQARKALVASNAQLMALMDHLVQAEKLKSLGYLAAGIAHELNTPLGNALLAVDTIDASAREFELARQHADQDPSIDKLIKTCRYGAALILRSLNRASQLIFSLKEASVDKSSERRRIDLCAAVHNTIALRGFDQRAGPHALLIDIEPGIMLETYPGYLEQTCDNLIANAIVHGFNGRPPGTIRLTAHRPNDACVVLTVSDDGNGIAARHLNHIFDPFFTTKLGQGGSGLGLHIVHTLVTGILGGKIEVSSEPGAGTQFRLELPLVAPTMNEDTAATPFGAA